MSTLFSLEPVYPAGFLYVPDFINEQEEKDLHEKAVKQERHIFTFQGYEAKRKVASFGYDWSFEHQKLAQGKEIPVDFHPLIEKVAGKLQIEKKRFAELLITEYPAGAVINWHLDAPPFDLIAGISLLADCTFRLRPYEKSKQQRNTILSLPVKRRSLYVMQGAARSEWQHSIAAVKNERYSITLRALK